ncbi:hypothetical protein FRC10_005145 [Ceratobasidium sp. 414]|nr:hypothetical protein FRC10_005145 [Ceratobasidium sp. 414]
MSAVITLPENYGYVALAAMSTGFLTLWQTTFVSKGRKKSGIKYPQMYAEQAQVDKDPEALKFNCAQRRILYTLGYNTGDPSKRNTRGGIFSSVAGLGLLLSATYAAGELALGMW